MMTIGELASQTGVPASTLRYWERVGVLPKSARVSKQRRYYSDAIETIAVLRLAQACGFTLADMRQLLHGFQVGVPASRRWQEVARRKRNELSEQIEQLRRMREIVDRVLECKCADLAECGRLAASVAKRTER